MILKENKSIVFKQYKQGNEQKIIILFEKVFGKTMGATESARHWQWEFLENPIKPLSIILAWDGGTLVGQYAVNPVKISVAGKQRLAAFSLDTMTHPEYSGLGIFTATAKVLYDQLAQADLSSVFGFPNANSVDGFSKKLGWRIICNPPIYIRPIDISAFIKSKTNLESFGNLSGVITRKIFNLLDAVVSLKKRTSGIQIRKEDRFDSWADQLWLKCRNQHKIWVIRNKAYLAWRYDLRPETDYTILTAWIKEQIAGYIVTVIKERDEGRICFIADLIADNSFDGIADALLGEAIQISLKNNAAMISAIVMPNSAYCSVFKRSLFLPLPKKLFPQEIFFGGKILTNDLDSKIFYDKRSWQISWGDTDLL